MMDDKLVFKFTVDEFVSDAIEGSSPSSSSRTTDGEVATQAHPNLSSR